MTAPSASRTWLRQLLQATAALWGAYLVAANGLLWSGLLLTQIHGAQPVLRLAWSRAWTWIPGRVHLDGAEVRIADGQHVEMEIRFDAADVRLDLLALPSQHFHLHRLEVEGATVRLRTPRSPAEAQAMPTGALPQFEGMPQGSPPGPGGGKVWRVSVDDTRLSGLREVWLDRLKLEGAMEAAGPFAFTPGESLQVGAARFSLRQGRAVFDGTSSFEAVEAAVQGALPELRDESLSRVGLLRDFSGRVSLTAQARGLGFLSRLVSPFAIGEGAAKVELLALVAAGKVVDGSSVRAVAPAAALKLEGYEARGPLSLEWKVGAAEEGKQSRLEAQVAPLKLIGPEGDVALVEAPVLGLRGVGPLFDLAQPAVSGRLDVTLDEARVPDLRPFALALGSAGFELLTGAATLSTRYTLDAEGRGRGEARLEASEVSVRVLGVPVEGELTLELQLPAFDVLHRRAELGGTVLKVAQARFPSLHGAPPGWWARVELTAASLDLREPLGIDARLKLSARDARPLLEPLWRRVKLPPFARDVVTVERFVLDTPLQLDGKVVELGPFSLEAPAVHARGRFRAGPHERRASVELTSGPLSVAIGLQGEVVETHLVGIDAWMKPRLAAPRLRSGPMEPLAPMP